MTGRRADILTDVSGTERSFRITDLAPPETKIVYEGDVFAYVHSRGNDFSLEDATKWGWIEEVNPVERFDDEWDIDVQVETAFVPLGSEQTLIADAMKVSVTILKGSETVLKVSGVPQAQIQTNIALIGEMLQKLNENIGS